MRFVVTVEARAGDRLFEFVLRSPFPLLWFDRPPCLRVESLVDLPTVGGRPGWPSLGCLPRRCRVLLPSVGDALPGGMAHEGGVAAVDPMTVLLA